jgi:ubiquinone/menaquinone biosynthesis C-methylase UbiE
MPILGSQYRGSKAARYEEKRQTQKKWRDELLVMREMLEDVDGSLLDVAVGTGRFLPLYLRRELDVCGTDVSEDMLQMAKLRSHGAALEIADATALPYGDRDFDTVVCVRLLHLLPEDEMRAAAREILRVARRFVILTVQLGPRYRAGRDTATHDEKKFWRLCRGWTVADKRVLTSAGWHMVKLRRTQ